MIIGIDPSYTSCGIAVCEMTGDYQLKVKQLLKCESGRSVYKDISETHSAAQSILTHVSQVVQSYPKSNIVCEVPASATRSGSYLNILNGYLAYYLTNCGLVHSVCWLPPTAYQHHIGHRIKHKSEIVSWCLDKGFITTKRVSQDACNALIFCDIWRSIVLGTWDKSYSMAELVNSSFKETSKLVEYRF